MLPVRDYRWTFGSNGTPPPPGAVSGSPSDESPEIAAGVKRLTDELSISPILAEILVRRGITTKDQARVYFRPTMDDLHDPFLMNGMDLAVRRILQAVDAKESILVYGDYDVDGTNGAALLYTFLRAIGARVSVFVPDRIRDGYGLTVAGVERAKDQGVQLLIAIDCGVTAVNQVAAANAHGIDVIICDHHEPGPVLPDAHAILNPLKPGCPYPFKHLCGCGVGFKLIQALTAQDAVQAALGPDAEYHLGSYLDMVALASTADIVALSGENRTLVKLGLELINTQPRPGIRALMETSGLKPGRITAGQIVFILAPRINAVGRLGDATRAVELLTCDSYEKALPLAQVFEEENRNRRRIDEETFLKAQELVEQFLDVEKEGAIVLHQESWHPGVIGIVASRLVERYYRPTIMLTTVDGVVKGSARSVAGFDIHDALKRCESTLLQFGGHRYAAGLSLEAGRIEEFKQAFGTVTRELLTDDLRTPEIRIDALIEVSDLTPKFIRILNQFAPFGPKNMRPVFAVRNAEVVGAPRIVGKNHLRFKVRQQNRIFDAIGFNLGSLMDRLSGRRVDLAFSIDESDYAGELVPQLKVRDIRTPV